VEDYQLVVSLLLYLALTRPSLCILCVVLSFELMFCLLIGCAMRYVPLVKHMLFASVVM
jgi:hypothetical protein